MITTGDLRTKAPNIVIRRSSRDQLAFTEAESGRASTRIGDWGVHIKRAQVLQSKTSRLRSRMRRIGTPTYNHSSKVRGIAAPHTSKSEIQHAKVSEQETFKQAIERLNSVAKESEEYDEEFLRPTRQAYASALNLLAGAVHRLTEKFPYTSICADGEGGLSLQWRRESRLVLLLVPPRNSSPSRIYQMENAIMQNSSANGNSFILAKSLEWLYS